MAKADDAPTSGRAARLSLPLLPDGTVDWNSCRSSTVEKILTILKTDPKVQSEVVELRQAAEESASLFEGITTENVSSALDFIAKANATVMQMVGAKFIKHPLLKDKTGKPLPFLLSPDSLKHMEFSDKQHAELDPRATRIAQKYGNKMPDWMKEHLDLYIFGAMFIGYTAENAKAVMTAQVTEDLKRLQAAAMAAAQPRGPQPDSDVRPNGRDRVVPMPDIERPPQENAL
jgi:hypothetical protein